MRPGKKTAASIGLGVALTATPFARATSTVYYDASTKRIAAGGTTAWYYNPGPYNGGAPGHILFDDVTVPSNLPQTLFNVTRVTFGITRLANAPAVTITPYYADLVPDAQFFGGPGDGPDYDPNVVIPQHQIATPLGLGPNGPSVVDGQEISFGNGVSTLFNIPGAFASPDHTYRSFALGLNFSTTDTKNGWTVALNSDNLDVLWDYTNSSQFAEFTYGQDANGFIIGTQYVKVEGLVLSGVAGDANSDGKVDVTDLGILATNWQMTGDYTNGDFNFDGFVDVSDLGILATNWQVGVNGPAFDQAMASVGLGGVSIPEPATLAGMLLTGLALLSRPLARR